MKAPLLLARFRDPLQRRQDFLAKARPGTFEANAKMPVRIRETEKEPTFGGAGSHGLAGERRQHAAQDPVGGCGTGVETRVQPLRARREGPSGGDRLSNTRRVSRFPPEPARGRRRPEAVPLGDRSRSDADEWNDQLVDEASFGTLRAQPVGSRLELHEIGLLALPSLVREHVEREHVVEVERQQVVGVGQRDPARHPVGVAMLLEPAPSLRAARPRE